MTLNNSHSFRLHRVPIGARKPSRELLSEAFSLMRRLHLPRRYEDQLTPQALESRATNLFSATFRKWNRFN